MSPTPERPLRRRALSLVLLGAALAGCAAGAAPPAVPAPTSPAESAPAPADTSPAPEAGPLADWPPPRPIPDAIVPPVEFRQAIQRGTRTRTGEPGPRYWQQWTDYRLEARLYPGEHRLEGRGRIEHHNRSPYRLPGLFLELAQNFHAPGAPRLEEAEVTGGVEITRLTVGGRELPRVEVLAPNASAYTVEETTLTVLLPAPLEPGGSAVLEVEWSLRVPQAGIGERMGYSGDDLYFLAYWYPRMLVFDDVVAWQTDTFLGTSEFYYGFGTYELTVEAPEGWVVWGTGELQNPEEVLRPAVLERLGRALASDEVVRVLPEEEVDRATVGEPGERLTWRFAADSVRDVAFSATRGSIWDATRTPVGDRDGDGATDYAAIHSFWRPEAPLWSEVARYAAHAIAFQSEFTGLPYPWPHMTAVEGSGIIGGGMEFPMVTLMGDYNARGDSALYWVTAHELAHMWIPMTVATDERRYAWIDEGSTSWLENQARKDFFPGEASETSDRNTYLAVARAEGEGEILRRSNFHYPGDAYTVASYSKPATLLSTLRGLIGEEPFLRGYRAVFDRWAFRHMYPWDLWNTFEWACGCELDWFWDAWYRETWVLDHAIDGVTVREDGSGLVRIADRGQAPMPVRVLLEREDGTTFRAEVPVERWLAGHVSAEVPFPAGAPPVRIVLDPEEAFPDVDRSDNVWEP